MENNILTGGLLTHEFIFYVKNLDNLYSNQGEDSDSFNILKIKYFII